MVEIFPFQRELRAPSTVPLANGAWMRPLRLALLS